MNLPDLGELVELTIEIGSASLNPEALEQNPRVGGYRPEEVTGCPHPTAGSIL